MICFPRNTDESSTDTSLSAHHVNWASAEDNMEIVQDLVSEEVRQGWVSPFNGDLAAAQDKWPLGVAIGKLGLALGEGRPARLVVDSSICGVNSRCFMPDKSTLPTARDILVIQSYSLWFLPRYQKCSQADGAYLSRYTAEYPPMLAAAFAKCIIGLINQQGRDFSLDDVAILFLELSKPRTVILAQGSCFS